jgi:peptidoglycan-associated lipoprotein
MRKDLRLALALVMTISLVCFMVSCSKKEVQSEPAQASTPEAQKAPDKSAAAQQAGQMQAQAAVAHEAAKSAFVNDRVHFAFDSAVLSAEAQQILNTKVQYMRANPEINVLIEGHCDERGTDAYNMALGARRANAVKQYLVTSGITADRLTTRSYGEERPLDSGKNKAAWAKNRRAQFVMD